MSNVADTASVSLMMSCSLPCMKPSSPPWYVTLANRMVAPGATWMPFWSKPVICKLRSCSGSYKDRSSMGCGFRFVSVSHSDRDCSGDTKVWKSTNSGATCTPPFVTRASKGTSSDSASVLTFTRPLNFPATCDTKLTWMMTLCCFGGMVHAPTGPSLPPGGRSMLWTPPSPGASGRESCRKDSEVNTCFTCRVTAWGLYTAMGTLNRSPMTILAPTMGSTLYGLSEADAFTV
mmetsp:Transcript_28012/g.84466  ORF Transcript_28012/g.84466 Transcript_28012/m.84466 type:complete len:233 (-) Transcript_28012:285-983(-)